MKRRSAEWRQRNRSQYLAIAAAWGKRHPQRQAIYRHLRRARLACALSIPFTEAELREKMSYWGNRCWMCRGPFEAVDHVKPIARGGPHILANLRPACHSCNSSKRAVWPLEVVMPR